MIFLKESMYGWGFAISLSPGPLWISMMTEEKRPARLFRMSNECVPLQLVFWPYGVL